MTFLCKTRSSGKLLLSSTAGGRSGKPMFPRSGLVGILERGGGMWAFPQFLTLT